MLGAVAVGASAIASAASNDGATGKQGAAAQQGATGQQGARPSSSAPGPGETLLTGNTADSVRKAALGKVPGATVLRVETDAQGSPYEAHLRKSDGSEVTVKVNKQFEATAVEAFGPRGGPGGRGAY